MKPFVVIYNVFLFMGVILGFPFILLAVFMSKKRRKTIFPRLGLPPLSAKIPMRESAYADRRPIWIHALSVGEVRSAVGLIGGIKDHFGHYPILFSVSTRTGFDIAHDLLEETVHGIFYFPYDLPFLVKRAIARMDPIAVMIVESDIWPNFLYEAKKRSISIILVNARMSDRSFRRYRRVPYIAQFMYSFFSAICTQSERDAQRFLGLGISKDKIFAAGNVKFDRSDALVSDLEAAEIKKAIKLWPETRVFLAGSTHQGEETIVFDSFLRLKRSHPELVMLIAPRDPSRGEMVSRLARSAGLKDVIWSAVNSVENVGRWDVMIVDTLGELARLYAIADIAFIGGSLVKEGGHNPLEPAAYGKPVLFGPDMSDFKAISDMMIRGGGAVKVESANALYEAVDRLLRYPSQAETMGTHAFRIFSENKGAVEKTLRVLEKFVL